MMDDMHYLETKHKKRNGMPWLFLVVFAFLLSVVIGLSAVPQSFAAQVTMEVYQQAGHKAFGKNTSLDIFNHPRQNGLRLPASTPEKLIAPFSSEAYTFEVYNNSASGLLPYSLDIEAVNPANVPIVVSLEKNGTYIYGGSGISNMQLLTTIQLPEYTLSGAGTDTYTLRWAWKTGSDATDTTIGNGGAQFYSIIITAKGVLDETDIPAVSAPWTSALLPKTGDGMHIAMWVVILFASMLTALFLLWLFLKRRRNEAEDESKTITESV